ncbi:hypothetical protein [Gemmobacter sp. LW-1]|uniref:restriction endonuclease n=1 Tax=Gemmobacter sp. LW-1 TaxID=1529005 RepID=UPI0035146507
MRDGHAQTSFTLNTKGCYQYAKFDSDPERKLAIILEKDSSVRLWMKPGPNQFKIFDNHGAPYQPDFVVETNTGKLIIEVKRQSEMTAAEVLRKADAASLAEPRDLGTRPHHPTRAAQDLGPILLREMHRDKVLVPAQLIFKVSRHLRRHPVSERTELAQVPFEAALEGELVLVGIGDAGIDELDLRHGGPFRRVAPCPRADALHEGEVGKNPAGLALRDAESAGGRQRHPPGRSAPSEHRRPQIRQTRKILI